MNRAQNILDVLRQLLEIVPPELAPRFKRIHDKIDYTAPELIPTLWQQTYDLLLSVTPVKPAGTWAENARDVWNKANAYCSSTNTAQGSSVQ